MDYIHPTRGLRTAPRSDKELSVNAVTGVLEVMSMKSITAFSRVSLAHSNSLLRAIMWLVVDRSLLNPFWCHAVSDL